MQKWIMQGTVAANPKARLFCFHHSGGSASIYRDWAGWIPKEIELCSIQLPGRESRFSEPFITSMPDLIDELLANLSSYLDLPFFIFGHSLGGMIGYEWAQALTKQGILPTRVVISACLPPKHLQQREPVHTLEDSEFLNVLKKYQGIPNVLLKNEEMMRLLIPRIKADFQLFETYTPTLRSCQLPIKVLGGNSDTIAPFELLKDWAEYADDSFGIHFFDGGHFYPQTHATKLAQHLLYMLKYQENKMASVQSIPHTSTHIPK